MKKAVYEILITIFAIISVIFAIIDISSGLTPLLSGIDNAIYFIFVIDYIVRFVLSKSYKAFFKENLFDLIAIIPFNSAFRVLRIAKLSKLLRLSKLAKLTKLAKLSRLAAVTMRLGRKTKKFFNTNGFKYMLLITIFFILLGAVSIHFAEGMPFSDGLWWAFVTTTTVGYGDISPASPLGRFVAMLLMLVGIGLIGSLTSTITAYFFNTTKKEKNFEQETLDLIKQKIDNVHDLTEDEINQISDMLKLLSRKK